ncbi:hypothetical protein L0F81_18930 [Streptomyces tricolor]|uniref:Uncharacterized protein n=1 Tax=Streptomyces tricolor TaxID=68277 RepID=A0ABS9JIE8_9ACTN|nr:hypothetical protein [Streptomyces tricolor]MCG0065343.1 hypothetical protein [Streptomyces tricolor]
MNDFRLVDQDPAPEWYGRLRARTDDLSPADWLTGQGAGQGAFGTVAGVAAPGFAAYARILHPARPGSASGRCAGPRWPPPMGRG